MKISESYKEASRYLENAKETLNKAGLEDSFYIDEKCVRSACGIAYIGILKALDFLFEIKGVPKKKGRKSIEYYKLHLSSINKKLLSSLNEAYYILHLDGYYGGIRGVKSIEAGFSYAKFIIDALKPYSGNGKK